jgi:ketosteroid isomerase-like protein
MATSPIGTVNAYFDAFAARDLDRAISCFATDADWTIPGDAVLTPWAGHRTGRQQIRQSLSAFFANVEPVAYEPQPLIETGDLVLAQAAYTSRFQPSGQLFTSEVVMRFAVSDSLITAYRVFEDSLGITRTAYGEPRTTVV